MPSALERAVSQVSFQEGKVYARGVRALLCVMTVLVMGVAVGAGSSSPRKTEVVRWSPFDSAGRIKTTLKVENVKGGSCIDIGYTLVGGIGYRCVAGNGLYDACWRDGPNPTESVICLGAPWQTTVERLRSPHLLLYPGVTFEPAADYPWSIVLGDGNRCTVVQGAHDGFSAHGDRKSVV